MIKSDEGFAPLWREYKRLECGADCVGSFEFRIALERGKGEIKRHDLRLRGSVEYGGDNFLYVERVVKFMLWAFGGYRFYFAGNDILANAVAAEYADGKSREFDFHYMTNVYRRTLEFICVPLDKIPEECDLPSDALSDGKGYRIGFDAGGSDRKVTAVIDGEKVFEDETVWQPKIQSDPAYHRAGIEDSIDRALASLGNRVDKIGVSTAGIVVNGEVRIASLFRKVPLEIYDKEICPIYLNLAKKYGCPVKVANDGDVTALAGAQQLGRGKVLGIAMGTSLAGGYVDENMKIKGYLNELAFVPVDADPLAAIDEWSGDYGVGGVYHSQDGVIRLAEEAGYDLSDGKTLGEKLKIVQALANGGDEKILDIYRDLGTIFGYSVLWFSVFYDVEKVMFLGRVASGMGGDELLNSARALLKAENSAVDIFLPDETVRRLGQSFTAALM